MITVNFSNDMKYSPFQYLHSEVNILQVVNTQILTKREDDKSTEDLWVKTERLFYTALIGYIFYEGLPEEKSFISFLDMLNAYDAREDDE